MKNVSIRIERDYFQTPESCCKQVFLVLAYRRDLTPFFKAIRVCEEDTI